MGKKLIFYAILTLAFAGMFLVLCHKKQPVESEIPCINDQPVEDTTRVYIRCVVNAEGTIVKVDTLPIYPKAVFARFYPWVTDTSKIELLAQKHNLQLYNGPHGYGQHLAATLCVTDDRRTEYHFTPYGKEGFCNFGADSLVEYAFATFADGYLIPTGNIIFKFVDGTLQTRIDSLFDANGLRLLGIHPDYPTGKRYLTLVTPRSKKNVLDLGYELNFVPFVVYASTELGIRGEGINCDE